MKYFGIATMKLKTACLIAALVTPMLAMPDQGQAAGTVLRAKFSFEGLANCENPPVRNFPIHGEGTGELSVDRTATLDMDSSVEGKLRLNAKLGAPPTEAPGGSASIHVTGRHTLRAVRDYPNNIIAINMTVRGSACSMTIENRLKPGKHQYTFYNGSGLSYCDRPQITHSECTAY
jgi:hypothetical protein